MKHGTISGYHDCKCEACREAWRVYTREWWRECHDGYRRWVDAAESRAYLRLLLTAGHRVWSIAQLAGVSAPTLHNIITGKSQRVRRDTEDRLLGIAVDDLPGGNALISSRQTRARIDQMQASGIMAKDICAMLGYPPSVKSVPLARYPTTTMRNHRRVSMLYELLARQGKVPASLLEEVGV